MAENIETVNSIVLALINVVEMILPIFVVLVAVLIVTSLVAGHNKAKTTLYGICMLAAIGMLLFVVKVMLPEMIDVSTGEILQSENPYIGR